MHLEISPLEASEVTVIVLEATYFLGCGLFFNFLLSLLLPDSDSDPYLYITRVSDYSGLCSHLKSFRLIPSSVSLAKGRYILPDLEGNVNHTPHHSPMHTPFRSPETTWKVRGSKEIRLSSAPHPSYSRPTQQPSANSNLWSPDPREKEMEWCRDGLQVEPRQGLTESVNFQILGEL